MTRLLIIIFYLFGQIIFVSCHIPHDREIICEINFKKARDLAYNNPSHKPALDSALIIVNRSLQCDSLRTAVVDLKIRLLLALGKFDEGSKFVDSLQSFDFDYSYKKYLHQSNFIALGFAAKGDTLSRDSVCKKMIAYIEKYILEHNLNSKEFQEASADLTTLQERLFMLKLGEEGQ